MEKPKKVLFINLLSFLATVTYVESKSHEEAWRAAGLVTITTATIGLLNLALNKEKRSALGRFFSKEKRRGTIDMPLDKNAVAQFAGSTALGIFGLIALYKSVPSAPVSASTACKQATHDTQIQTEPLPVHEAASPQEEIIFLEEETASENTATQEVGTQATWHPLPHKSLALNNRISLIRISGSPPTATSKPSTLDAPQPTEAQASQQTALLGQDFAIVEVSRATVQPAPALQPSLTLTTGEGTCSIAAVTKKSTAHQFTQTDMRQAARDDSTQTDPAMQSYMTPQRPPRYPRGQNETPARRHSQNTKASTGRPASPPLPLASQEHLLFLGPTPTKTPETNSPARWKSPDDGFLTGIRDTCFQLNYQQKQVLHSLARRRAASW